MAGDWIKMRTDLQEDPSVIGIAAQTGLDEDSVVGKLHRFWSWVDRQSRDGSARSVTKSWIDRFVHCEGFATAMENAGWLLVSEAGIQIPNFDRHNSKTAKNRGLSSIRASRSRSASSATEAHLEKRREEKNKNTPHGPPKSDSSPIVLTFKTAGSPNFWNLTESQITSWSMLYPGLDLLTECRAALAWTEASNEQRKTAKGMKRFLVRWFNRTQNSRGHPINGNGRPSRQPITEERVIAATNRLIEFEARQKLEGRT